MTPENKLKLARIQIILQLILLFCIWLVLLGNLHKPIVVVKTKYTIDVEKVQMLIDASSYRDKDGKVYLTETSETLSETIAENIEDNK